MIGIRVLSIFLKLACACAMPSSTLNLSHEGVMAIIGQAIMIGLCVGVLKWAILSDMLQNSDGHLLG